MSESIEAHLLKLKPGRKERWEQAVDENEEYDSLRHLVALAVERELGNEPQPSSLEPPVSADGGLIDGDSVHERLDSLSHRITAIGIQLDEIESKVTLDRTRMDERVYAELETHVTVESDDPLDYQHIRSNVWDPKDERNHELSEVVEVLQYKYGMDEVDIKESINRLEHNRDDVEVVRSSDSEFVFPLIVERAPDGIEEGVVYDPTWVRNPPEGEPHLDGTSVTVRNVVNDHIGGLSNQEIAEKREIRLKDVDTALYYARQNPSVMREIYSRFGKENPLSE